MARRLALLLGAVAMVAYCAANLEIGTDITKFMPDGSGASLATLSRRLANSELTRTMVLSIAADDVDAAFAAAAELDRDLAAHPEVAWTRTRVAGDIFEEARDLYFPRRFYFASNRPENEIPAMLTDAGLAARARQLKYDLAAPMAPFLKPLMAKDPLGLFQSFLDGARGSQPEFPTRDGQLASRDGEHAMILLATVHSHFDSGAQTPFLADLRQMIRSVEVRHGHPLRVEMSGANRIAVSAEQSMKRDIYWIGACTFVGVAVLFTLFFRSPTPFVLAIFPALFGMVAGTTAGLISLGGLDGLSIAFAAALIGVAVDYSIHVINHHALSSGSARASVRRLTPSLLLGATTTMASFAGLMMTTAPAFRELGFLAIAGIGAAIAATLYVLPEFLGEQRRIPALSRRVAVGLSDAVGWIGRRRTALAVLTAAVSLACLAALPQLQWGDDLTRLGSVDGGLIAEDIRVRGRLPDFETGRFVIALGADEEDALRRNDEVYVRLTEVVRAGDLGGVRSLHHLLWSTDLQQRNLRQLRGVDLRAAVDRAFRSEGFRAGAFAGAFADLDPPPPPLTLAELERSVFGPLVDSLALTVGDEIAIITYLRDVRSPSAVAAALTAIDGVILFDQREFVHEVYAEFRATTLRQILVGSVLVALLLLFRYRAWRPALAAILPSLLVVVVLLGVFSIFAVETNLLHVIAMMMVMGMGVDYGVFLVDACDDAELFSSTMLSLLLSCLTTILVFGALAISEHPALRAIGVTTGLGVFLAFVFAPVSLLLVGGVETPCD